MSARSKFHSLLKAANFSDSIQQDVVAEILGDHAHELAERIRNSKKLRDYTDGHMSDCNMAADLIDTEFE